MPGELVLKIVGDWTTFDAQASEHAAKGVRMNVSAAASPWASAGGSTDPGSRAAATAEQLASQWRTATAPGANPTDPIYRSQAATLLRTPVGIGSGAAGFASANFLNAAGQTGNPYAQFHAAAMGTVQTTLFPGGTAPITSNPYGNTRAAFLRQARAQDIGNAITAQQDELGEAIDEAAAYERGLDQSTAGPPRRPARGATGSGAGGRRSAWNSSLYSVIGRYAPAGIALYTAANLIENQQTYEEAKLASRGDPLAGGIARYNAIQGAYASIPFVGGALGDLATGNVGLGLLAAQQNAATTQSGMEASFGRSSSVFSLMQANRQANALGPQASRMTEIQNRLDLANRDAQTTYRQQTAASTEQTQARINAATTWSFDPSASNLILHGQFYSKSTDLGAVYAAQSAGATQQAQINQTLAQTNQLNAAIAAGQTAQIQLEQRSEAIGIRGNISALGLESSGQNLSAATARIRADAQATITADPMNPNNTLLQQQATASIGSLNSQSLRDSSRAIWEGELAQKNTAAQYAAQGQAATATSNLDPLGAALINRNAAIASLARNAPNPDIKDVFGHYAYDEQQRQILGNLRRQYFAPGGVNDQGIQAANAQFGATFQDVRRSNTLTILRADADTQSLIQAASGNNLGAIRTRAQAQRDEIAATAPTDAMGRIFDWLAGGASARSARITAVNTQEAIDLRTANVQNSVSLQQFQNRANVSALSSRGYGYSAAATNVIGQANEEITALGAPGVTDSAQKIALTRQNEINQLRGLQRQARIDTYAGSGRATYDPFSIGPGSGVSGGLIGQQAGQGLAAITQLLAQVLGAVRGGAGMAGMAGRAQ